MPKEFYFHDSKGCKEPEANQRKTISVYTSFNNQSGEAPFKRSRIYLQQAKGGMKKSRKFKKSGYLIETRSRQPNVDLIKPASPGLPVVIPDQHRSCSETNLAKPRYTGSSNYLYKSKGGLRKANQADGLRKQIQDKFQVWLKLDPDKQILIL